jgi:hypothetical protein
LENLKSILYPAFHKFYNALNSLEKFEKGSNFFDNIGHLDNFFSEYRNITFVLQKSLAKTEYMPLYERLRNKYLVNDVGKWFIDKRNSVLKEKPFDLEKRIIIKIYTGKDIFSLPELAYTIENDVEYSSIIESLRSSFLKLGEIEIFFSVEFTFYEKGAKEDLYDNFIFGITQMKLLLAEMRKELAEDCILSEKLEKKIEDLNFYRTPKDFFLVDDYTFNCTYKTFERASRSALSFGDNNPRSSIKFSDKFSSDGDIFHELELMHLAIMQFQETLMPTCIVIFKDDTFEINSFHSSIRTTVYRKFNEIANRIDKENIKGVFFVSEMRVYDTVDVKHLDSYNRIKYVQKETLAFFMIDNELKINYHSYDMEKIKDQVYVTQIINSKSNQDVPAFMNPLKLEFKRLLEAADTDNNAT